VKEIRDRVLVDDKLSSIVEELRRVYFDELLFA
jgi:hypothetical protein